MAWTFLPEIGGAVATSMPDTTRWLAGDAAPRPLLPSAMEARNATDTSAPEVGRRERRLAKRAAAAPSSDPPAKRAPAAAESDVPSTNTASTDAAQQVGGSATSTAAAAGPPVKKTKLEKLPTLGEASTQVFPELDPTVVAARVRAALTRYKGSGLDHEQARLATSEDAHAAFRVRVRAICWPVKRGAPAPAPAPLAPADWPLAACIVSVHPSGAGCRLRTACKRGATAVAARLATWLGQEAETEVTGKSA